MATRWSAEEQETLKSLLADGVEINLLKKHLPNRTDNALHRQAQNYGYGVKTVNGATVLYFGKRTRNRKKKTEEDVSESTKKIVGESRTPETVLEPTTSECLDNKSDVIVADSANNANKDMFIHLYSDIGKLLNSKQYSLKSITVSLENTVLTVSRGEI